jgi:phospholipase C
MLENRSFDHVFGFRKGVNGLKGTETNLLDPSQKASSANPEFKVSNAEPYSISAGEGPSHSFNSVTTQLYGKKTTAGAGVKPTMDGFVKAYRESLMTDHVAHPTTAQMQVVMEAFAPGTLPALEALADNFVLCDNWFCEVPGPTMPNRMFVHMASSGGFVHNVWDHIFDDPTIYNRLEEANKTWATYSFDANEVKQFSRVNGKAGVFRDYQADLAKDLGRTGFPNYVFIVPRFFAKDGPVNSMHGPFDARPADQLVADIYNKVRSSPIWPRCLLVITFDEHGGFFDHVAPPATKASQPGGYSSPPQGDTASWVPKFNFDRIGLRVPTLLVSPWLGKGEVVSDQFQHTSILSSVHTMFGTKPLTNRDESAKPFVNLFVKSARTDAIAKITSVEGIPSPKTFGAGVETDHGKFGLDSLQHELVLGVHSRTKDRHKMSVGTIPDTQKAASEFVRRFS